MTKTKTLGKQELIQKIKSILSEAVSTRGDLNRREIESSFNDFSGIDDEIDNTFIDNDVEEYDPWKSGAGMDNAEDYDDFGVDDYSDWRRERQEELPGGIASGPTDPFELDESPALFECDDDKDEEQARDMEDYDREELDSRKFRNEALEKQIVNQIIKNIVKEQFSDLGGIGGIPSGTDVTKTNGNGVTSVISRKKPMKKVADSDSELDEAGRFHQRMAAHSVAISNANKNLNNRELVVDKKPEGEEPLFKAQNLSPEKKAERMELARKRAAMKAYVDESTLEEDAPVAEKPQTQQRVRGSGRAGHTKRK